MSHVPSVPSVSTPPVPLAYNFINPKSFLKSSRAESLGNLTIAPALKPVPKFDGHVSIYPR